MRAVTMASSIYCENSTYVHLRVTEHTTSRSRIACLSECCFESSVYSFYHVKSAEQMHQRSFSY